MQTIPENQLEIVEIGTDGYVRVVGTDGKSYRVAIATFIGDTAGSEIGDLSDLTTDQKNSLVEAINEIDSHADTNAGNISTNATNISTNATNIGTLANLTTTAKSNLVGAINEVDADLTEVKEDLTQKISTIEDFGWSYGYVNISGVIDGTSYTDRQYSSYLLCPPDTSIQYVGETNHSGVFGISFYDSSKSFISGVANNGTMGEVQTVTSPSNARYCIISTKTTIIDDSHYLPAVRTLDYVTQKAYTNSDGLEAVKKTLDGKIRADVSPVEYPSDFSGGCAVNVYTDGYHYITDFDADDYKNTGGSTLYVSPNAGSSGAGTIDNPYNYTNAYSNASDGDTIVFLSGFYTRSNHFFSEIKKSINLIGEGTVTIGLGELTTFTAVDGYTDVYIGQRSSGTYVFDISDAPNKVIPLTSVSSLEECAATVGSYYKDSSYYRVHPYTSGNPTGKLLISVLNYPYEMPLSVSNADQSVNVYFENINVIANPNGTRINMSSSSNTLSVCYNKVNFILCGYGNYNALNVYGGDIVLNECSVEGSYRDGLNYNGSNVGGGETRACNVVEIGCKAHNCGIGQATETMNASTSHLGCKVVRVNGEYSDCLGPNVADVQDGTQSVNFGCMSYASRATASGQNNGFQCSESGAEMWCYNCIGVGSDIDFNITSSGTMTIEKCAYDSKADAVTATDTENATTWMMRNLI